MVKKNSTFNLNYLFEVEKLKENDKEMVVLFSKLLLYLVSLSENNEQFVKKVKALEVNEICLYWNVVEMFGKFDGNNLRDVPMFSVNEFEDMKMYLEGKVKKLEKIEKDCKTIIEKHLTEVVLKENLIKKMKETIERLERELKEKGVECDNAKGEIDKMKEQNEMMHKEIVELKESNDKQQQEIVSLNESNAQYQQEIQMLKETEINNYKIEIEKLKESNNNYQQQLQNANDNNTQLQSKLSEYETTTNQQQTSITSLQTQIETLQKEMANLTQTNTNYQQQLQTSNETNTQYQKQLSQYENTTNQQSSTISTLQHELNQLHLQLNETSQQNQSLQHTITTLTSKPPLHISNPPITIQYIQTDSLSSTTTPLPSPILTETLFELATKLLN